MIPIRAYPGFPQKEQPAPNGAGFLFAHLDILFLCLRLSRFLFKQALRGHRAVMVCVRSTVSPGIRRMQPGLCSICMSLSVKSGALIHGSMHRYSAPGYVHSMSTLCSG